jgi:diacylglycerol kinase family enzyme
MKSSIIIIANPASRTFSLSRIREAEVFLQQQGFGTKLVLTQYKDHAQLLARQALEKNPYCITAAGGDGTINEIINGIANSAVPLGILPLGTANVLARELSLPLDAIGAMKRMINSTPQNIS